MKLASVTGGGNVVKPSTSTKLAQMYGKQMPISIDEKHTTMMNEFTQAEETLIPKMKREIETHCAAIRRLDRTQVDEYLDLCDKIKQLRAEIKLCRKRKTDYLLDNSLYVFSYFEEKKNISSSPATTAAAANTSNDGKRKLLNAFFKIKTDDALNPEETVLTNNKYRNARQFWANVNNDVPNLQDYVVSTDVCQYCGKGELISQEDEGAFICNHCGATVQYVVDSEKPSYKEPPGEVSYTAYVRLNHFKEVLSQFQAKETTQIPDDVLEAIKKRIKKERISDMSEMTYLKTRDILRKLGYNRYFEHVQYINCMFGVRPPVMSEELVETLCVLFIEIQSAWAIHCPSTRTNFFNYGYTLYQLCRLVGADEYCSWIQLLKDPLKTMEQDNVWKKVCATLGWKFFPTRS